VAARPRHQGLDVDAIVHALDRAVVDEPHRVAEADELGVDDVGPDDRLEMTGEETSGRRCLTVSTDSMKV
jgi:hypothetical protein